MADVLQFPQGGRPEPVMPRLAAGEVVDTLKSLPVLNPGDSGVPVKQLQSVLAALGLKAVKYTGMFDEATGEAVGKLRDVLKLPAALGGKSPPFDEATRDATLKLVVTSLGSAPAPAPTPPTPMTLQIRLAKVGAYVGQVQQEITPVVRRAMNAALAGYAKARGLDPTNVPAVLAQLQADGDAGWKMPEGSSLGDAGDGTTAPAADGLPLAPIGVLAAAAAGIYFLMKAPAQGTTTIARGRKDAAKLARAKRYVKRGEVYEEAHEQPELPERKRPKRLSARRQPKALNPAVAVSGAADAIEELKG